jgi:hypothetical protein
VLGEWKLRIAGVGGVFAVVYEYVVTEPLSDGAIFSYI